MSEFELLGGDADETRLLIHRATGYSLAIPGRPRVIAVPDGKPVYAAVVAMADVAVQLGFRLDALPTAADAGELAFALATAYTHNRAGRDAGAIRLHGTNIPKGAGGAARAMYQLASGEMEQLRVLVRSSSDAALAIYSTIRFSTDTVNPVKWAHIRTSMAPHERWDGLPNALPILFPKSALSFSTGKLELMEPAFQEAQQKARALAGVRPEEALALTEAILAVVRVDDLPPTSALFPPDRDHLAKALHRAAPSSGAAEILLANVAQVVNEHDWRAWLWQQIWALGNRG